MSVEFHSIPKWLTQPLINQHNAYQINHAYSLPVTPRWDLMLTCQSSRSSRIRVWNWNIDPGLCTIFLSFYLSTMCKHKSSFFINIAYLKTKWTSEQKTIRFAVYMCSHGEKKKSAHSFNSIFLFIRPEKQLARSSSTPISKTSGDKKKTQQISVCSHFSLKW